MIATSTLFIISLATFFTSFLSAICGMGGGIVLLTVLTSLIPYSIVIPIHGIIQLVSNFQRTYLLRKYIVWKIFLSFILGAPFGTFIAIKILKKIQDPTIPLLMIVCLIFYTVFKPTKKLNIIIPDKFFFIVGLLVGILGPLIGATGPFIAIFFVRKDLSKESIVATKSAVQIIGHLLKIPAFFSLGFAYEQYSISLIIFSIAAIMGTQVGVRFLKSIDQLLFQKIFKSVLFLAAIRIVSKIVLKKYTPS